VPADKEIDEKSLSRKYRTNVSRLIRAWKRGWSDLEISTSMGVDPVTLNLIREDIEMAHRRLRLARRQEG